MTEKFTFYNRKGQIEARPMTLEDLSDKNIQITPNIRYRIKEGKECKAMIARDPHDHTDQWAMEQDFFDKYYVKE